MMATTPKVFRLNGPEMVTCTVDVMRHFEEDKTDTDDPQTRTHAGEIAAFGMGVWMRRKFYPRYGLIYTSTQPRGYRHAELYVSGLTSYTEAMPTRIQKDPRLNDFSTDKREIVVVAMAEAKTLSARFSTEVEMVLFQTPKGMEAIQLKVAEALSALAELKRRRGDFGMIRMHGACIEGLVATCLQDINPEFKLESAMATLGGQFDKCEGARLSFDRNGRCIKVEMLRLPPHLKALFAVLD